MQVGTFEAKTKFSALLDRVEAGEEIVITRHGRPVARLVAVNEDRDLLQKRARAIENLKASGRSTEASVLLTPRSGSGSRKGGSDVGGQRMPPRKRQDRFLHRREVKGHKRDLAQARKVPLLTNDKALRKAARSEGVGFADCGKVIRLR